MKITLPVGDALAGPVFAHDVDGDGNLDVVVYAHNTLDSTDTYYELLVAYGNGKGDDLVSMPPKYNFQDTPPALLGPQNGKAGHYLCLTKDTVTDGSCITDPPLAVADFNGDQVLDVVNPCGLFLANSMGGNPKGCGLFGKLTPVLTSGQGQAQAKWSSARAVDLNADGRVDLVTASCADTSLAYYENAGVDASGTTIFNTFSIPTTGGVDQIVVGDFDGDLVPDLVFAQRNSPLLCSDPNDPTPSDTGALGAVFGAKSGGPSAAFDLGVLDSINSLIPGALTSPSNHFDLVTDLVVLSKDEHHDDRQAFQVFEGSTARALVAPHYLVDNNGPADPWLISMASFTPDSSDQGIAVLTRQGPAANLFVLGSNGYDLSASSPGSTPISAIVNPMKYVHNDLFGAWSTGVTLAGGNDASVAFLVRSDDGGTPASSLSIVSKGASGWPTDSPQALPLPAIYHGPLVSADMDGDGSAELVAVSDDDVIVIWNDPTTGLDVNGALRIKDQLASACSDAPGKLQAVVAVQGATGKGKQLVVVAENHAYLVSQDPSDSTRRTFAAATCLDDSFSGFYPYTPDYTGASLSAGDVDGDGVDDVVLGRPGEILVFSGIPVVQ